MRARSVTLAAVFVLAACAAAPIHPQPRDAPAPASASAAAAAPAPQPAAASDKPPRDPSDYADPVDCAALAKTPSECDETSDGVGRHMSRIALLGRVLCAPRPKAAPRPPAWDRATTPAALDLVEQRYGLSKAEREHLFRDGFVVASRLEYSDYAYALHDVYQSQLPIYVSVDAILHAVYASNDKIIAWVEHDTELPMLRKVLRDMASQLASERARYAGDTARDADLYLTVARRLLDADDSIAPALGDAAVATDAAALVAMVGAAAGFQRFTLFGRERTMDLGQFKPRGHYAAGAAHAYHGRDLSAFFRATMWLSRIEMNLVTRSSRSSSVRFDPDETPRDAKLAMALADLAARAGVAEKIARLDRLWGALAGPREDVSPAAMASLMKTAGIVDPTSDDAPAALRAAIGSGFQRSARTHVQAEGSTPLPAIATLLGPRITPDTSATRALVHGAVRGRYHVPAADVAYFLGHDRALDYEDDRSAFPTLARQLDAARASVADAGKGREDLYSSWLAAIRGLAQEPQGVTPSYMHTEAFRDLRIDSAIAAYGQIRHNYVLYVPVTYDESGCEIPDGWVEPAPATYRALIDYADRGARAIAPIDAYHARYFARLGAILKGLERIAERELAGEPLRDEEKVFLASVMERASGRGNGYMFSPERNGWYYDLFLDPEDAVDGAKLVADYFVSSNDPHVDYAGVASVRMGFFVVDAGGAPRVMVGPVARGFGARGPVAPRYSDDDVGRFPIADPWAASYTAPSERAPAMVATVLDTDHGFAVDVRGEVGEVTVTPLDHHGAPVATITKAVRGSAELRADDLHFPDPEVAKFGVEAVRIQVGQFIHIERQLGSFGLPRRLLFGTGRAPWTEPSNPRRHVGPAQRV